MIEFKFLDCGQKSEFFSSKFLNLNICLVTPASWETYMQVRKQQLELDMEQQTGSK